MANVSLSIHSFRGYNEDAAPNIDNEGDIFIMDIKLTKGKIYLTVPYAIVNTCVFNPLNASVALI